MYAVKGGKNDHPRIVAEPPKWSPPETHHGVEGFTGKPTTWTYPAGWTHPRMSYSRCYDARQLPDEAAAELHRIADEIDRLNRERWAYVEAHFLEWPIAGKE